MLNIICDDDDSSIESSNSDPEEADNNSLFNECRIKMKNLKPKEPRVISNTPEPINDEIMNNGLDHIDNELAIVEADNVKINESLKENMEEINIIDTTCKTMVNQPPQQFTRITLSFDNGIARWENDGSKKFCSEAKFTTKKQVTL
uniref:Uncharacterized protein n=1 Tax=Meloidogyne javanica TaxID=6303 RepID=A0A915LW24_MELJA